jgi:hypothetical protein
MEDLGSGSASPFIRVISVVVTHHGQLMRIQCVGGLWAVGCDFFINLSFAPALFFFIIFFPSFFLPTSFRL